MAIKDTAIGTYELNGLAPYLSHLDGCTGEPCTCGLLKAIEDAEDRVGDAITYASYGDDI